MLETFDFRHHIDKSEYQQVFGELFAALGECQRSSRAAGVPVILVFEGWDAAGKGTLLNRVTQALDPRGFTLQAIKTSTQDERFHPMLWRYWIRLPGNGHWALFDRSWYGQLLTDRLHGELSAEGLEKGLADVVQFERQLAEAGAVIVKFWLQISKHEQKRRFKRLLAKTATAWKVGPAEREQHRHYEKWCHTADHIICQTGSSTAPWKVINDLVSKIW